MAKTDSDFLTLLNSRLTLSKKFHKKWFNDVKRWLKYYEINAIEDINAEDLHNKLQIPYIFSTIESALPSMFNSFPKLIIKGRGKQDQKFGDFISDVWEYVYDKTQLEEKIENAGTMFLITGIGQMGTGWITETETVEEPQEQSILNEDGTPAIDENGQPITQQIIQKYEVPTKDMPQIDFKDYKKIFYSPESEFVVDDVENKIPYVIECKVMLPEEVKEKYGKDADEKTYLDLNEIEKNLDIDSKDLDKGDLQRVNVYEYTGLLPKKYANDKDWKSNRVYKVCFTKSKILKNPEKVEKKSIYQVGNYGVPTKFFKFGEPKVLRDLELDVSFGRSTLIDYRDKFATKLYMDNAADYDEKQLKSPKKFAIVKGPSKNPPQYITPPPFPETVMMGISQTRQDIAMASAQLDVGRGGDSSTVDTATGQKIFQEAQDKRIERKRKKIAKFIEAIARNVLIDCAKNWDIDTFIKITDANPEDQEFLSYVDKMKGLGDEWDIEIEPESVISNKATMGAQSIAMYREMKEDPMVNRMELIKEAIKNGFSRKNVDQFISQGLTPEQMAQAVQSLVEMGALDPNIAQEVIAGMMGEQPGQGVGRPPSANPTDIMKKSMPAVDQTQIEAQTEAAPKQIGVDKGPQGV